MNNYCVIIHEYCDTNILNFVLCIYTQISNKEQPKNQYELTQTYDLNHK